MCHFDAQEVQTDGAVSSCKSCGELSREAVHRENTSVKTKGTEDTCGDVLLTFTTSFSKGLPIPLWQHQAAQEAVMDGWTETVNQPQQEQKMFMLGNYKEHYHVQRGHLDLLTPGQRRHEKH